MSRDFHSTPSGACFALGMHDTTAQFGHAIRQARLEAGLAQSDVTVALGWSSPSMLSAIELGKVGISTTRLEQILVTIDRLRTGGLEQPPQPPEHRSRGIRLAAGIGLRELARELAMNPSRLLHYEVGRVRVTSSMERRILDAIRALSAAKAGRP